METHASKRFGAVICIILSKRVQGMLSRPTSVYHDQGAECQD